MLALLACSALMAVGLDAPPADPHQAYQEARARAGRSPDDQVKLALWCEAHGLTAERLHHLTLAVLADPRNAAAPRGLMGLVSHDGRWQHPDAVSDKVKADAGLAARLAEYNQRRAKTPDTADAQWKLALWCEENGLKPEATAHLTAVVRLDPSRDAAWKRLGCKKYEGRWLNDAAIAAEKSDAEAQKMADKKWRPLLHKYRDALRGKDDARRAEAQKTLDDLTDHRAVRSVWATFATAGPWGQGVAVRILGQIDAASASRALTSLAVFGESAEVRRAATETLKGRDPREYAGLLIALLRDPIHYEVRPVNGPGSPGALFVQGERFNVQRRYSPPPVPGHLVALANMVTEYDEYGLPYVTVSSGVQTTTDRMTVTSRRMSTEAFLQLNPSDPQFAEFVHGAQQNALAPAQHYLQTHPGKRAVNAENSVYAQNPFGFTVGETETVQRSSETRIQIPVGQEILEYEKSAYVAQQQLAADVALMDRHNAGVKKLNERVSQVLRAVSGQDRGSDRKRWMAWLVDLKGYVYYAAPDQPRPTIVQDVPLAYYPQQVPTITEVRSLSRATEPTFYAARNASMYSCFGGGTPVRTLTGPRPIESLRVGDRVLTLSTATGALGYQPVVALHHNPPSPTFLIHVAGDTIVSSPFHRFWKAGKGWVMARDIRAGDRLRMLDGVAEVSSVEGGKVQLVYNLDVAEDADFFAGNAAALVHDNTLPDPRLVPFDLAPATVAAARQAN